MATYYEINGQKVQNLASDPSPVLEGQVWYNTTSDSAKVAGYNASGVWTTVNPVAVARQTPRGLGSQDAGLIVGGQKSDGNYTNATEEYNGSSWSTTGVVYLAGQKLGTYGTQTAGVSVGGSSTSPTNSNLTGTYDGASWTASTVFPTSVAGIGGSGSVTAGLIATGNISPGSSSSACLTFDSGTFAATANNVINNRASMCAIGTQTASILVGGQIWPSPGATSDTTFVEDFDGTSWSANTAIPVTTDGNGGLTGHSTSDDFILFGFSSPLAQSTTLRFDSTSWSTDSAMNTARLCGGFGADSGAAIAASGRAPAYVTDVESYEGSGVAVKTITVS